MSPKELRAFDEWLTADTRNKQEFERITSVWDAMEAFKARPFPARWAARSYHKPAFTFFRWPTFQVATALIFVLSVTLIFSLSNYQNTPDEVLRTAKGERMSISLADGSGLDLNTDTELRVAYSRKARTIHLHHGEALFTVSKDDERPFVVIAGSGRILDLSTSFNVRKQSDHVAVTVIDGAVQVTTSRTDPVHMNRGDKLSYTTVAGEFLSLGKQDPESVIAWRDGRIRFDQTPLKEVMSELTRYHPITYVISDPAIAEMKISGTFRSDDLRLLFDTLEAALPVQATLDDRFIRLDHAAH